MSRPARAALSAGTCLLLLGTAACGVPADSAPRPIEGRGPNAELGRSPSPAPTGTARAVVYLVRDDRLVAVVRGVPAPASADDVLAVLAEGPTGRESDAGLSTAVLSGTALDTERRSAGIAFVAVPTEGASDSGRSDEVLGFAQVVLTLTSLTEVTGVRFLRDGNLLDVPRADGSLSREPLTRRDYTDLL